MRLASLILLGCAAFACAMPLPAQTPQEVAAATRRADALIAEMRGRLQEDRLIEPPGESAADVLRVLNREAPERPEILELSRELFERLLQKGRAAMRARAYDRSAQLLQVARDVGAFLDDPALERAESELKMAKERDVPLPPLRR